MPSIVAIVGRPNVGKSTLFNRLTQTRQAIVDQQAGVTRDRQYGKVEWTNREFSLIDTGGWVLRPDDVFEEEINRQVQLALNEADLILFLVDITAGVTTWDSDIAHTLRRANKPVLLVANKADNYALHPNAADFYALGLGEPLCLSAINGAGSGDLLDSIIKRLPNNLPDNYDPALPRIAVIGRPNVGKSSLINALIGEQRHIVTNIAGTTRDAIYTHYNKFGIQCYLVDTAGIRKKAKVNEDLEYYAVVRAIRAIENADVCLLLLDASRGIESQDTHIASIVRKNKKSLIVCINKWDLLENKSQQAVDYFLLTIRQKLAPLTDLPILPISALNKQRIFKTLQTAKNVYDNRQQRIPTPQLNDSLLPIIQQNPPPTLKGKYIHIKYITQLPNTHIPTFVFFTNLPQWVKEPYKRFLENLIRQNWNFAGTPIDIFFRQK